MKKILVYYKLKVPYVFERNIIYSAFPAYYTYKTVEEAQKEVDEMNKNHSIKDSCGNVINWEIVDHFFIKNKTKPCKKQGFFLDLLST